MPEPIRLYQRDAFTRTLFRGNPAAVVPLPAWRAEAWMQAVAAENALSETAFLIPCACAQGARAGDARAGDARAGGSGAQDGDYDLRWFTPTQEVSLCGHATLAAASVVLEVLSPDAPVVTFHTRSGPLRVAREGDDGLLAMEFPSRPPRPCDPPPLLAAALRAAPRLTLAAPDDAALYAVFDTEAQVRALAPDFPLLLGLPPVAVTAPGGGAGGVDFVSRFFAPAWGIPEDPVTGSTHCALAPYWAARLGRSVLYAQQASARGGDLFCALRGGRVMIAGYVTPYLEGTLPG